MEPTAELGEVRLRGLPFGYRRWKRAGAPRLILIHGAADCSATWQFVVEALKRDWDIIAPDLRGHGRSHYPNESLYLPEMVADIAAFVEHWSPDQPAILVGHSMGGLLASMYAGTRPHRVAHLIMLDSLWEPPHGDKDVVERYTLWLNRAAAAPLRRSFQSVDEMASRLMTANPRLIAPRAARLARDFARPLDDGRVTWAVDPYINRSLPLQHSVADFDRFWGKVSAPVLWIGGLKSWMLDKVNAGGGPSLEARLGVFSQVRWQLLDAGHNVHHEQPEQVATLLEEDLLSRGAEPPAVCRWNDQ
jgi:pimeloyl-ACP methyl ester carboxylesterase